MDSFIWSGAPSPLRPLHAFRNRGCVAHLLMPAAPYAPCPDRAVAAHVLAIDREVLRRLGHGILQGPLPKAQGAGGRAAVFAVTFRACASASR